MAEARTDDRAPASLNQATLHANVAALRAFLPRSADHVQTAHPPPSVRPTVGRDGSPTFNWTDETGRLRWLGRTSMPSITSKALTDAFQDGGRNILLVGLGEGSEARLLLDRLSPHQAVMIVEEDAWSAALALGLHDFSDAFRGRRMPLFVGPAAWDDLRQFLLEHDGYLTPERMLSWPWFDGRMVADLSSRLLELSRQVAQHRADRLLDLRRQQPASPPPAARRTIALITNVAQPGVQRLADRLSHAAEQIGWSTLRLVLDDPSTVHPLASEAGLAKARPAISILLETGPQSLQYQLPPGPIAVVCIHGKPLATEWVKSLPATVTLVVATQAQHRHAIEAGRPADQVLVLSPAASPGLLTRPTPGERTRVLVLADGADASAGAVGLHLASHCQLWEAATTILEHQCDTYIDEHAPDVLSAAERRLKIKLDSDDVRAGLVERIREALAPAVVRRGYCSVLMQAGVDFDLYGDGWTGDPVLSSYWRGPWPGPWRLNKVLEAACAVVFLPLSGEVQPSLLDCVAGGLAGLIRSHPMDLEADGLGTVLDPSTHVWRFGARAELVRLVQGVVRYPAEFASRTEAAARHVEAHHTWTHRLQSILHSCGVD